MQYDFEPIDTSSVSLDDDLQALVEVLARNTHNVWGKARVQSGWSYGPVRDDAKKQSPCLVTYEALPDLEREYDRKTAIEVLKTIQVLGYTIERQSE